MAATPESDWIEERIAAARKGHEVTDEIASTFRSLLAGRFRSPQTAGTLRDLATQLLATPTKPPEPKG